MPEALPSAPPVRGSNATHPCVRCGRPVPLDVALCERCNPLGLSDPAASQAHGTVFLAIVIGVVLLAVAGRLALSGIGPFEARITAVEAAPAGLAVTVDVRNEGTKAGPTTCRITDPANRGVGPAAIVQSPPVEAGQSRSFTATIGQFGVSPRPLAVVCEAP
ncbi:MAG TPA: hypothetical protein VGQ58_07240 [Candidatus Limnocylindrales bacterium]|jgi:hypothetical protein|nr:hypothetical protein [Candidatus Limnocylindrales bacterium]